jgi:hypothetical protein
MTDQELMDQFERGTLPNECFHHREHVRVAFLYLSLYPALEAIQLFSRALQRFATAHGKPQLYHETITWALMFLIRERMARSETQPTWDEFSRSNADLLALENRPLSRYYREETLASELARAVFIFPDKLIQP